MKKFLTLLLSLLLILAVFPLWVSAEDVSGVTGDCSWSISGSTLTVSGNGSMADYSSFRETPWYDYSYSFSTVKIKEGVKHIGSHSFNHYALMYLELPSGLISIGESAFVNAQILDVTLPKSLVSLGDSAFEFCERIKSVTFHENFASLGSGAFGACSSLTTVSVADNNPNFNCVDNIIYSEDGTEIILCPAGIESESFTVAENVTTIGSGAFYGCKNLKKVTLHQNVTEIKKEAFSVCSSLENINIPEGITEIHDFTFERCSALTNIKLPESLNKIGMGAFYMGALEEIVIPKNVTKIGITAFYSNQNLTAITLPSGLKEISSDAFFRCDSLETVYYCGSSSQKKDLYIGPYNSPLNSCNWVYNSCIGKETHDNYLDEVCTECGFVRLFGDNDTNGKVDTSDLANLKIYLAGTGEINLHNADMKYDGKVDTSDLANLKLYLASN